MLLDPLCAINMTGNINHNGEPFVENNSKSIHYNPLESLQEWFMSVDINSS